jgi:CRISPR/Cas system-associated protein Cas10 (large subunit of type III CRISPR-Cas system)
MIAPSEKYPLYQAADLAGKALDKSKGLEEKDGVTFLDMPMKWDMFTGEVIEFRDALKKLLEAGVSRGFLQKMYEVYDEYEKQKSKHGEVSAKFDDRYGRWRWLLTYVIARTKVLEENQQVLEETKELVRKNIEYLPIAVRWVEYLTRRG